MFVKPLLKLTSATVAFAAIMNGAAVADSTQSVPASVHPNPVNAIATLPPAEPHAPGPFHPVYGSGPAPFDVIVDLKFPPQPVQTPSTPGGSVPAPRYNVGGACANLSITMSQVYATEGAPGASTNQTAVLTNPIGTQTPTSSSNLGLACVTTFAKVTRGFSYYITFKYANSTIAFTTVPAGAWSNPVMLASGDPTNPTTHTQWKEVTIAIP